MSFPLTKDYGGFTDEYRAALNTYQDDIERRSRAFNTMPKPLRDSKPAWFAEGNTACVCHVAGYLPWPIDMKPVRDSLVGYTAERDMKIVEAARFVQDGMWVLAVRCERE